MSTLTQSSPNACITQPQGIVRGWIARFRDWRARRRNYTETMNALTEFDARTLRDLGINRYDFEAIARGNFRH